MGAAAGYRRAGSTYRKRGMGRMLEETWPMAWLPLRVHLHHVIGLRCFQLPAL